MTSKLVLNDLKANLPAIASGSGVWLTDTAGRRYLDACSGAVVSAIGHGHPSVLQAAVDQLQAVTFTHRGAFGSEAAESLADTLADLTGFEGVWFVNSGSEAVEAALQFALQYYAESGRPERRWFLSSSQSYHGNTLGGLSLSGHARRRVVENLALPFASLPSTYAFRERGNRSEDEYAADLLKEAREQFSRHAHELAGVVLEPVGGATLGATVPPTAYVQGLRELCDEFDVLLIADEVLTGLGRTGTILASDYFGVHPDIVAIGKGLGAGYTPIAAALIDIKIIRVIANGSGRITGGHTYAGNPLSTAIAASVIDVLISEDLINRGAKSARYLWAELDALADRHHIVVDHRGLGMLQALEFEARTPRRPLAQGQLASLVTATALGKGVIVYAATGGFNEAVVVAPPLTITRHEIDELIAMLEATFTDVAAALADLGCR